MNVIQRVKVGDSIYKQLNFPIFPSGYEMRWTACDEDGKPLRDGKSYKTLDEVVDSVH